MLPSFGWTEMLMIAIVLIVVIGPKDAIAMMKSVSKSLKGFRQMAGDLQRQFNEALDEADLGDIKDVAKEMRELDPRKQIKDAFKPLEDVGKEIADDFGDGADEIEAPAVQRSSVDNSLDEAGAKMRAAQAEIKPKAIVSLDDTPPVKTPSSTKRPAARKAPAKKPTKAAATGTKTAAKTPATKKPATKAAAAKTTTTKPASAKRPATKKPAAKKPTSSTSKAAAKAPAASPAGDET
ncbi:MAG: Sec-independent protein translocase protein TatB [Pseudomonadota bacterium]